MVCDNNLWKLQIFAERAWRLAMDIAMEAGRLNKYGGTLARIADETRSVANRLHSNIESIRNGGGIEEDFSSVLEKLNIIAQNGCIEMLKLNESLHFGGNNISIAVILDEVRKLACDLIELFQYQEIKEAEEPEIIDFSNVVNLSLFLFHSTIGGRPFIENIQYVQEIISYDENQVSTFDSSEQFINLRGIKVPVINLYGKLGIAKSNIFNNKAKRYAVIINTDWAETNKVFAVLVDNIASNSIFKTRLGLRSTYKSNLFPSEFVREAWEAAGDEQAVFLDWIKLAEK